MADRSVILRYLDDLSEMIGGRYSRGMTREDLRSPPLRQDNMPTLPPLAYHGPELSNPGQRPADAMAPVSEALAPFPAAFGLGQAGAETYLKGREGDYAGAAESALPLGLAALPIPGAKRVPRIENPIRAYHGSPHDFDKFDLSKIGTGEGAQAYGHGLYFAEHEPVARGYRDKLEGKHSKRGNLIADELLDSRGNIRPTAEWSAILDDAHGTGAWRIEDSQLHTLGRNGEWYLAGDAPNPGRMYEVALHATPESFLDWDKPLSGQSQQTRKALEGLGVYRPGGTAAEAYERAQGQLAKDWRDPGPLRDAGIPGIKYLDQGSRTSRPIADLQASVAKYEELLRARPSDPYISGLLSDAKAEIAKAERGTSNYSVWSPKIIEILRKYGILGPVAAGVVGAAMSPSDVSAAPANKSQTDQGFSAFDPVNPYR